MPCTTVQKTTGAMIILISLMKPSPSGFIAAPVSGQIAPRVTPIAMAISTWTYSKRQASAWPWRYPPIRPGRGPLRR